MLIRTWVGIIFVKISHLATTRFNLMTNIMPTQVLISVEHEMDELFIKFQGLLVCKVLFV